MQRHHLGRSASPPSEHARQAGVGRRYVQRAEAQVGMPRSTFWSEMGGTVRPLILAPPTWKVHANRRTIPSVSSRLHDDFMASPVRTRIGNQGGSLNNLH